MSAQEFLLKSSKFRKTTVAIHRSSSAAQNFDEEIPDNPCHQPTVQIQDIAYNNTFETPQITAKQDGPTTAAVQAQHCDHR